MIDSPLMEAGTHLDLVDVAYGMVELNWAPALHVGLIRRITIESTRDPSRNWRLRPTCIGHASISLHLRRVSGPPCALERSILSRRLNKEAGTVLHRSTEVGFGAFDAVLRSLLPLPATLREQRLRRAAVTVALTSRDGLHRGAHGSGDTDCVWVIASTALNPVARGQEGVEPLNEVWVSRKELGHAINHTGRIDAFSCQSLMKASHLRFALTPGS